MAPRGTFDPLKPTQEPRWYAVRNMHGALLEARELPPGASFPLLPQPDTELVNQR